MKKSIAMLSAVALTLSLASCGASNGDTAVQTAAEISQTAGVTSEATPASATVLGRITAVSGDTVTVTLDGRFHGMNGDRHQRPDGELPQMNGEAPTDGEQPPELPNGEAPTDGEQPPELPDGEAPQMNGNRPQRPNGELPRMDGNAPQTEGETLEIDLGSATVTKDGENVTAESLSEGDLVEVTLDENGEAVSLRVVDQRSGFGGRMDRQGGQTGRPDDTVAEA